MSELIDNTLARRAVLKHLILELHSGKAPEHVQPQLMRMLGRVPYNEVVAVEQELISEGVPIEEIQRLCDLHSAAVRGAIDHSEERIAPPGHPVHTFKKENEALLGELELVDKLFAEIGALPDNADASEPLGFLRVRFSRLGDIEKHYSRKENLLFPYLEQKGITGPSTVMWGKDNEVRDFVKAAGEALLVTEAIDAADARELVDLVLHPAVDAIKEMVFKEEEILFPMALDKLSDDEWYAIAVQSPEIGFCIYDPVDTWVPSGEPVHTGPAPDLTQVNLATGSLNPTELECILNTIPFDLTFVGADDTVRYFTQGRERIFDRNRAIIGRKVQMCHPPASVHIVQRILDDFKSGKADHAPFWINLKGKFIHIEYFAVRDRQGAYLGTLEVSQDLTEKRALTGEQRLLSYTRIEV